MFTTTILLPEDDQATWCISTVTSLGHPEQCAAEHGRANSSPVGSLARAHSKLLPGVCSDSCVEGCLDSHSRYNSKQVYRVIASCNTQKNNLCSLGACLSCYCKPRVSTATSLVPCASLGPLELNLNFQCHIVHPFWFFQDLPCFPGLSLKGKAFKTRKSSRRRITKNPTQWDRSEFCNLMLRIPLKLGHRGKGGKPEDLRKEQGI